MNKFLLDSGKDEKKNNPQHNQEKTGWGHRTKTLLWVLKPVTYYLYNQRGVLLEHKSKGVFILAGSKRKLRVSGESSFLEDASAFRGFTSSAAVSDCSSLVSVGCISLFHLS